MRAQPTQYTATAARQHWAEIMRRVEVGKERITIVRHTKTVAIIVPISDYRTLQALANTTPESEE